jgi:hypothetical protein
MLFAAINAAGKATVSKNAPPLAPAPHLTPAPPLALDPPPLVQAFAFTAIIFVPSPRATWLPAAPYAAVPNSAAPPPPFQNIPQGFLEERLLLDVLFLLGISIYIYSRYSS